MKENSPDNYDLATSWRWKLIDGIHCWMAVLYLLLRGASHAIIIVTMHKIMRMSVGHIHGHMI